MNATPFRPHPSGPAPRLHAWRCYPYRGKCAPLSGYYAVRHQTEFVYQGNELPKSIRA